MKRATLIECSKVQYRHPAREGLAGIDLAVSQGERIALLSSPAGSGTILLKICATLEVPTAGEVKIFGQRVDFSNERRLLDLRRRIALVFHESTLISNLSLLENAALSLSYHENRRIEDVEEEVMELLLRLGLEKDRSSRPSAMDPFKRRRAIYAMELLKRPWIILLDQPLRDFPRDDRHYFEDFLDWSAQETSCGILMSTQNQDFVRKWAGAVLVLKDGGIRANMDPAGWNDLFEGQEG